MKEKMKNTIRRVLSVVAALAMVFGMVGANAIPTMAAQGTITITPPSGTDTNQTHTYSIYKIFDATGNGGNISYKMPSDRSTTDTAWTESSMGTYFEVDRAGNISARDAAKIGGSGTDANDLSSAAISAIKSYVEKLNLKETAKVVTTGTTSSSSNLLDNGYYYITTTTGSLVTITSTNPTANVNDKNTVPTVTKKIDQTGGDGSVSDDGKTAIAQAGNTISYVATVKFGKGSTNVKFHDRMGKGLAKITDSKIGVSIKNASGQELTGVDLYQVKRGEEAESFNNAKDDITIVFKDGIPENSVATITYSAKVINDDMSRTNTAAQNTAWVTYGSSNAKTPDEHTYVYSAKFVVTKVDQSMAPLAGAGFVLKSSSNTYYKLTTDPDGNKSVSWVKITPFDGQSEEDAVKAAILNETITELKTTEGTGNNILTFTGLPNGTFTLVETTVPAGYNRAADYQFTINSAKDTTDNFTEASDNNGGEGVRRDLNGDGIKDAIQTINLERGTTVKNVGGSVLPSTGGIGTAIFYVIGGAVVAGAAILLIARRKKNA